MKQNSFSSVDRSAISFIEHRHYSVIRDDDGAKQMKIRIDGSVINVQHNLKSFGLAIRIIFGIESNAPHTAVAVDTVIDKLRSQRPNTNMYSRECVRLNFCIMCVTLFIYFSHDLNLMNNSKIVNATTGVVAKIQAKEKTKRKKNIREKWSRTFANKSDGRRQRRTKASSVQTVEFYFKHEIKNKAASRLPLTFSYPLR